ncbi:MAG: type 4a pilus biogenesis protein PilO, partial [Deltaproteobacteria bacterium]|nr:type 4a pilus biogenesis protein PilO [Deltaproteobacteria bacterium]
MQDFARLPPQKKAAIFIGVGVFAFILYFRFILTPLNEEVEDAENSANAAKSKATAEEQMVPKYQQLREKMATLQDSIDRNQKMLPTDADSFFGAVQNKAKEAGVAILKWTRKNEEPVENFVKVPLDIELAGSFMQLKRFFASLVQKPTVTGNAGEPAERIVSIENLVIQQPLTAKKGETTLSAKFIAVTYRQDNRPAAGVGSGSGAAPV